MPRLKKMVNYIEGIVHAACDKLMLAGTVPTVPLIARICKMSNRDAGPHVKSWKDKQNGPMEIPITDAEQDKLEAITQAIYTLLVSVLSRQESELEAKWAKQIADSRAYVEVETGAAHDELDKALEKLKAEKRKCSELTKQNKELQKGLIEAANKAKPEAVRVKA